MRPTLVAWALRQHLIRFRHGKCNQITATGATGAAGAAAANTLMSNLTSPSPRTALNVKPPHVVKPLGPNVMVVSQASSWQAGPYQSSIGESGRSVPRT